MPARMTAAQPVLSQRMERSSASSTSYLANLYAWSVRHIALQEWVAVDVKQKTVMGPKDPFEAVAHEYRISNCAVVVRDAEPTISPVVRIPSGERYHVTRGRLLAFKKQE